MTDKEIIIDSIDIRKCKHFEALHESRPNGFGGITIENYCYLYEDNCEKYPQCLYRSNRLQQLETQLQREKQNSQEAIDTSIKEFNRAEELKTLLKRKEQECEELKKELHKNFEEKNKLHLIIDRLLEASGYDTNTASAEDFEDVYENMRYEKQQLEQFGQTLTDIKEMLKDICMEECSFDWNKTSKKHCGDCDCRYGQILQKISKSEVDNDR